MLNLANKRYIEKVTVSLNMIKISPTFICISAMEKGYLGKSFIMPGCWVLFLHFINFFHSFIIRTCREPECGHYERTWSLTMAGYTTLLFIFFVIQTICQGKEFFMHIPSLLPLQSPTPPSPDLPSFAPLLILFSSHQIPFIVFDQY